MGEMGGWMGFNGGVVCGFDVWLDGVYWWWGVWV
jgi:hypothetical protein